MNKCSILQLKYTWISGKCICGSCWWAPPPLAWILSVVSIKAVCSWKYFCGLARCLSALPGTRPQWGLGLKSGGRLEAQSELAAPPWSKMSRRPTWLVVSCNWYITTAAMEGEKEKIKMCVSMWGYRETQSCEEKDWRERRRREGMMEIWDKFFDTKGFLVKKKNGA